MMASGEAGRMRVLLLLLSALLVAPALALSPHRDTGRTDLRPLETYLDETGLVVSRGFELEWEAGIARMHSGDYAQAVGFLSRACEQSPEHPTASFVYALALLATERDALAAKNLRGAIGLYPGWNELSLEPADFFASDLDFDDCRNRLERDYTMSGRRGADPDLLALLGALFYFGGEVQKARIALDQLQRQQPDDRVANHFLAGLARRGLDVPDATEIGPAPEGTIRRDASDPRSPVYRGDPFDAGASLLYRGDYARAMERFAEAIARDPGHPYAFYELSQCLFALGRYEHAATTLRAGLDRNPAILASGLERRRFYDDPSRLDAELRNLQVAIEVDRDNPDLILLLGFQLLLDGQAARAKLAMELVDRSRPGDRHARSILQAILNTGTERAPPAEPLPPAEREDEPPGKDDDVMRTHPALPKGDGLARFLAGDHRGAWTAFLQAEIDGVDLHAGTEDEGRARMAYILSAVEAEDVRGAIVQCDELLRQPGTPSRYWKFTIRDLYQDPADVPRMLRRIERFRERVGEDHLGTALLHGFLLYHAEETKRAREVFLAVRELAPDDQRSRDYLDVMGR